MGFFDEFHKKEKPVFTGLKFGFGSGSGGGGGSNDLSNAATGGTRVAPGNGYAYHFFTTDTPTPERKLVNNITRNVDYLIIGGGGAGGNAPDSGDYQAAGGGGAGAFLTGTSPTLSAALSVTEIDINFNNTAGNFHVFEPNVSAPIASKHLYAAATTTLNADATAGRFTVELEYSVY